MEAHPCLIMTTRQTGGLLAPIRDSYRPAPKDAGFHSVQATMPLTRRPPLKGVCNTGYPLKGSSYSFTLSLSIAISYFSCS